MWCDEFLQPGAIVYLDDLNMFRAQKDKGLRKAWFEYLKQSRWNFDLFLNVSWSARNFIVLKKN